MIVTTHFRDRVRTRIGPHVDAVALSQHIIDGIDTGDSEFIARVNRRGVRCFRFQVPEDGRFFYALVETDPMKLITVLPAGWRISRQNAASMILRDMRT